MIIDQAMPYWDEEQRFYVIQETEEWVVCVVPQIFNDRICIADKREFLRTWSAGWCYEKTLGGVLAGSFARGWDPDAQWAPQGFKKIAFDLRPHESHLDLDQWQYVCLYCQHDLRIGLMIDSRSEEDPMICRQCGAMRDNGAWFEGIGSALRFPTGTRKVDAG